MIKLKWKIAQFFEALWWKKYLRKKPVDEYLKWKNDYWKDFLAKAGLKFKKNENILDVGCGPAGIFLVLPDFDIDGVDPLIEKYEKELQHFKKSLYPNTKFYGIPFEEFNPQKKYDKIFAINAINHFQDIDKSVEKLFSLIKDDGKIIISIDAHKFTFLKKLFQLIPGDILHPHQFSLDDYSKMFHANGAKMEKTILLKATYIFDYYLIVASLL